MKIIADQAIPYAGRLFPSLGDVELADAAELTAASVQDADCLVVRSVTRVDRELLDGAGVRCVASASSGVDHVDHDYLASRNIPLFCATGCNARAVAEYVLSCLFILSEQYGMEVPDQTVGIIGCGHAGGQLRRLLHLLGVRTRVYDPFITDENGRYGFRNLDPVLSSDIISLHVPLTASGEYPTARMVDQDFLDRLKPGVTVINTARGAVVDEQALVDFAGRNPESRLVLDVWDNEPHVNMALLGHAALATPHVAGYSARAKLDATRRAYEQVCAWAGAPAAATGDMILPGDDLELDLSGIERTIDAVRLAVLACYDVRTDCAAFRAIETMAEDSRSDYFTSARADYPFRREFSDLRVRLSGADDDTRERLSGLGFDVVG